MRDLKPAIKVIKEYEGCVLHAYQDPVQIWTIGYGHTHDVYPGQMITRDEAEQLLMSDVRQFSSGVEKLIKSPITNNMFCALVSFAFNVGLGALGHSTLLKLLNGGKNKVAVADEFLKWTRAGNRELPGLKRRRRQERELFMTLDPQ